MLPWQDPYAQQPPTTPHNPYLTPEDTFPTSSPYAQPVDPAAYAAEHEDARGTEPAGDGRGGGRAGGTHRARRSPMRYVLPAILGALVLVLIGIGMAGWLSSNPNQGASPAQSQVHVSTPATTASTPTASKPTASVSQSPTTAPTHSASPSPKPRPTATKPPPPPVVHAPTIVLNETTQTGLAAEVAQHLRGLGWTVTGVGNWRGNISTTTVYYSPGQLAAARRLAYDLGVSRIRPAVPGMLGNHLTVVLTSDPLN